MYKKLLSLLFVCTSIAAMDDYYITCLVGDQFGDGGFCAADRQILPAPKEEEMDPYTPYFSESDPYSDDDNAPVAFVSKSDIGDIRRSYRVVCFMEFCKGHGFTLSCMECNQQWKRNATYERSQWYLTFLQRHMSQHGVLLVKKLVQPLK